MARFKIICEANSVSVKGAKQSIELIRNMAIAYMYENIELRFNGVYVNDGYAYRINEMNADAIQSCNDMGYRLTQEERLRIETDSAVLDFSCIKTPKGCNVTALYEHSCDDMDYPDANEMKDAIERHLWAIHIFEAIQMNYLPRLKVVDFLHYNSKEDGLTKEIRNELNEMPSYRYANEMVEHYNAKHHDLDDLCYRLNIMKSVLYETPRQAYSSKSVRVKLLEQRKSKSEPKSKQDYLVNLINTICMAVDYAERE